MKQRATNTLPSSETVTHVVSLPLRKSREASAFGVLTVCTSREAGFEKEEIAMLEELSFDIGFALHSAQQRRILEELKVERISNYEETILAFVHMIEQRDSYTAGHTLRVARYCTAIAREMGYDEKATRQLEKAAILHDTGKVATPDSVLLKSSKLTKLEYELIKHHADAGYAMQDV